MHPLETYAREIHAIRGSGAAVKETSYYTALANLLNKVGKDKDLKPKIRFVSTISNQGWGIPDGGLFTIHQFQRANKPEPLPGHKPERGVVEVKGTGDNVDRTATTAQVEKYLEGYGQVLVTNYRDFLLVGRDADGQPVKLERYRLASSETAFHAAHTDPEALVEEHGERFVEYLKRVMLHNAPLTAPKDVAWFLASYARDARVRLERQANLPALAQVRSSLEDALGIKFEGERGEHFFRSTLVQTLFYGIFSAWVLWSKEQEENDHAARFNWHDAVYLLRVPMIQALFEQVAMASRLRPLGLIEVLDWTAAALNRVDRTTFFANFEEGHAVQYFYEPFLEAFDPALRKQLGVWYTPQEIVRYMVARVDTVLREELGLPDGLADPRVYVLDPCCGTGTYIVEVLKRIAITLKEQGADALLGDDLKRAAMERIFGFEILPAPFVVAHLQLGLLLQNLGAPLSEAGDERAGVYLTNALTGWEPANSPKQHLLFPELEAERDAAERVKRETRILVILGNPPYNAFAGVSPKEEQGLVEPYKRGLISEWGIKKFNLDDLYVRFFRLAERHITEATRQGVVCYISNFSYLSDPSFVVMRQRFLAGFDSLWFDSLNGDSRETGKQTPEGKPDPSAFSTEQNREGIRVGATIGLMVRQAERSDQPLVRFRQFWGVTKREDLLASVTNPDLDAHYETAMPTKSNRYSFRPSDVAAHYEQWPKLTDLGVTASNGLMEKRGGALIDIDRDALEHRMQMYYDPLVSWETLEALDSRLTTDAARFDAKQARAKVLAAERYEPARLQRYALRPLETRWGYFSAVRPLWNGLCQNLDVRWREGGCAGNVTALIVTLRSVPVPCPHCAATTTTEQARRTALGYRTFRCRACGRFCNERTGTPYNALQYPTDVVLLVVLWRLRYKLSLRDVAEMFLVRGIVFTHETVRDWEARFAPLLTARLQAKRRGQAGTKWHVDETYLKVNGRWCYLYRAIDREGNLVEALLSEQRDMAAAQRFFTQALGTAGHAPAQVTTDGHDAYPRAIREALGSGVHHRTSRYKNNRIEQDHRGVKQRYYPMRGFGSFLSAARFCSAFEEQRQYFRAVNQRGERIALVDKRHRFQARWATVMIEFAAA